MVLIVDVVKDIEVVELHVVAAGALFLLSIDHALFIRAKTGVNCLGVSQVIDLVMKFASKHFFIVHAVVVLRCTSGSLVYL